MLWRGTVPFIVFISALFLVLGSSKAGAPILQVFVMISFGILGLVAVVLLTRTVRLVPDPMATASASDTVEVVRPSDPAKPGSHFEPTRGVRRPAADVAAVEVGGSRHVDNHGVAQGFVASLAPRPARIQGKPSPESDRRFLAHLVREAEELRLLGRLLKLDLATYRTQLTDALAAGGGERVGECVLITRLANEELRWEVERAVAARISGSFMGPVPQPGRHRGRVTPTDGDWVSR